MGVAHLKTNVLEMFTFTAAFLFALGGVVAAGLLPSTGPRPNQIKNLVTFGDSYTDVVSAGLSVGSVSILSNLTGCDG